jgi:hypothetical protein
MQIQDVNIIRKPLVLAKNADVDRLESEHWLTFPDGYRQYVTQLGEGVLGGNWVRIYPPWRIARELDAWRDRIRRYWFWGAAHKVLPKPRAIECIIVGDTTGGDELIFHPSRRDRLFVLPRESQKVFEAGADLLAAIDWVCSSAKLIKPFAEREFEPFDSRKQARRANAHEKKGISDPIGESFDAIVSAAARWAKRHKLLQRAKAQVKSPLKKLPPKQMQVTPGRQSLIFVPGKYDEASFATAFELSDTKTGLDICTLEVQQKSDDNDTDTLITPNLENWEKLKKRYGGDTFDDF